MDPFLKTFYQAMKPRSLEKVGLELETFLFHKSSMKRVSYQDSPGLQEVLRCFLDLGWTGTYEKNFLLGATKDGAALTLEPGGQLEFSGAPCFTLHEVFHNLTDYLSHLSTILDSHHMVALSVGFDPISHEVPFIPKERYHFMSTYWQQKSPLSLEMMLKTASIQVNFDYCNEEDMALKASTAAKLQPLVSALFGHSPLKERQASGYLSYRNYIWTQMEASRTGTPDFMLSPSFKFQDYIDYLLDTPLFFILDNHGLQEAHGDSFRSYYTKGSGQLPTDETAWNYHISTVFPDVRLKNVIEIRNIDALPFAEIMAPVALWTGLLYDPSVFLKASHIAATITKKEWAYLHSSIPHSGMQTQFKGQKLDGLIHKILELSLEGLSLRHKLNGDQADETIFLTPTLQRLENTSPHKRSLAQNLLQQWALLRNLEDQNHFLQVDPSVSPFPSPME